MIGLIKASWNLIKRLFGLVFPMFANPGAPSAAGRAEEWVVRLLVLFVFLGLLSIINATPYIGLYNKLQGPIPSANKYWLPLVALLIYILCWMGWLLWRSLNSDVVVVSEFPDIDAAWHQIKEALEKAGVPLQDTPVFLILGHTRSRTEALYQAAGLKPQVNQVPRDPGAPVRVTATRDAIYLTCDGASCLGRLSVGLADVGRPDSFGPEDEADAMRTMGVDRTLGINEALALAARGAALQRRGAAKTRANEYELEKARLRYFCRLLGRDRLGLCPINGALLLIPVATTGPSGDPEEFAKCCKADLGVAFEVFRLRCPVLALVCDLETLPGFSEILDRLPAGQTSRRMGQRFPLVPDVKSAEIAPMIEGGLDWVGNVLFPNLIYSLFRLQTPGALDESEVVFDNSRLFRFLAEVRKRQERLSRILTSCFPTSMGEPLLFGGCYLGGTGDDDDTEQAFVAGVFKRLVQDQDLVSWSAEALQDDDAKLRLARFLSRGLAALVVVELALIGYLSYKGGMPK